MKPIAVYTAITGSYDSLKPVHLPWKDEADFIAYLDKPDSTQWQIRKSSTISADNCRNAKTHKILPRDLFEEYDISVWIDGAIMIKSLESIRLLTSRWLKDADIALFRHETRNCIYQEGAACISAQKDDAGIISRQLNAYRESGYPENAGLYECTILVRRHTAAMRKFCEAWHGEIDLHSRRDQISFPYVVSSMGLSCNIFEGSITNNPHFLWVHHDYGTGVIRPVVRGNTSASPPLPKRT